MQFLKYFVITCLTFEPDSHIFETFYQISGQSLSFCILIMNQEPIEITCRKCSVTFPFKSIVQHVNKSDCKTTYSEDQKTSLRKHSQEITSAKHRIKKAKRYQQKKAEIAKKYQQNKVQIAKKYQQN